MNISTDFDTIERATADFTARDVPGREWLASYTAGASNQEVASTDRSAVFGVALFHVLGLALGLALGWAIWA